MLIKMSQEQINNLMSLLDRVEIKGFKEIQVMTDIVKSLQQARPEVESDKANIKK
ncbi:MAG: hypothetical protein KQ78_01870 [Candidatus Izimaplasma bacterium HR2]|nr:MAG: hypothetical protein KQ78_01870 [Candidatus Izimaplasma bacterium HR2]